MSRHVMAYMDALMEEGEFKLASDFARMHERRPVAQHALFWFTYGRARNAAGLDGSSQLMRATMLDDCNELMRGAVHRDLALLIAHMGDFELACRYVQLATYTVRDDANFAASVLLASARVGTLFGQLDDCLELHARTHRLLTLIGSEADQQLVAANLFFWLRLRAARELPRRNLYEEVRRREQRSDRRREAALFFWTGPVAAHLSIASEVASGRGIRIRTALDDAEFLLNSTFDVVYG